LESEEEEEEEEEDQEEEESDQEQETDISGLETPSGVASVVSGIETPMEIPVRTDQKRYSIISYRSKESKPLFTVLSQQETSIKGFMGSAHTYHVPSKDKLGLAGPNDVDVALNPEELESMDSETLKRKYQETVKQSSATVAREDLSDMVTEHETRQQQKRGRKEDSSKKKHKEFKF
jgi:splicing factor 3B subunit 2